MVMLSHVVLWGVVGALFVVSAGVLAEVRRLTAAGPTSTPLAIDATAPRITGVEASRLANLALLFVTPYCSGCVRVLAGVTAELARFCVVVCHGDKEACSGLSTGGATVVVDADGVAAENYGVSSTPTVVAISDGRIRLYERPSVAVELTSRLTQISES